MLRILAQVRMQTIAKQGLRRQIAVAWYLLRKRFDLSQEDGAGILGHLAAGGDLSRWGMLNAVTRYAQDVESYDKSTDLEKLGGTILDMAAKDWKAIAV